MRFLNLFRKRRVEPPVNVTRQYEPVQYLGKGAVGFRIDTIQRLEDIANKAAQLREQQEALAAECCELLGCDPDGQELDTDYATEIVYMGLPIGQAFDSIIQYREMRDKECP